MTRINTANKHLRLIQTNPTRKRRNHATIVRVVYFSVVLVTAGLSALSFNASKNIRNYDTTCDHACLNHSRNASQIHYGKLQISNKNDPGRIHEGRLHQAQCSKIMNDPTIRDPNRNNVTQDETKRLTITDPPFWISLHAQWFDKIRWSSIMEKGEYYETGVTSLFQKILSSYQDQAQSSSSSSKPLVLDIGMNIGWFSLYSRASGHEVAAFEPNPVMFLRMCESLEYNNWIAHGDIAMNNHKNDDGPSVSLWQYGLGDQPGVFNLTLRMNPGASSFRADRVEDDFVQTMAVQVITLDTVAIQEGWFNRQISLMKVDVEGFEPFVIRGGKKLLFEGWVENLIMENSVKNRTEVEEMVDFLFESSFRIKGIYTVSGDPYHEDWWPTFNSMLQQRHDSGEHSGESDQIKFLSLVTCNIWWVNAKFKKL